VTALDYSTPLIVKWMLPAAIVVIWDSTKRIAVSIPAPIMRKAEALASAPMDGLAA
jgi:hypothetical protein